MKAFKPAAFLNNAHLQTLYSPFFKKKISLEYEIERFDLEEGDFLECYWNNKNALNKNNKIVVLLHGLEGSYNSPYIKGLTQKLEEKNYTSVVMHFRGCAKKENVSPKAYHSGETQDLKKWLHYLKKKYKKELYLVSYSMAGNVLLKYLGEEKDQSLVEAAVCVCAPLQLNISAKEINKGFSKVYQYHLLKHLKKKLLKKFETYKMQELLGIKKERIKRIKTIQDFDDIYTAKIYGFSSAMDYYKKASALPYLKHIQQKTLIIHALDDPFMNPSILPKKEYFSKHCILEVHKKGGHVGFIAGSIFKPKYYLEERILSFLESFKTL